MTETLYIRDPEALVRLVERISGADEICVDTEFLRERTYYPRLCLLQLATDDLMALVDPLEVPDLGPLWDVVCGGPKIVVHAGSQDLEIVQRQAGRLPQRLFDTQVAAAFLGLGYSIGYSKLVEAALDESPARSEAYTDWSRRPLTDEQRQYALDDVRYLLAVARRLEEDLAHRGRLDWVAEETTKLLDGVCHTPDPDEQWRRVKGARGLSGRALVVLQEVTAWREREAIRRDIPRQRVLPDRVLTEIARRAPRDVGRIAKLRGIHPGEASRSGAKIVARVEAALSRPQGDWPRWPELPPLADDPSTDAAASLLDAVVRSRAQQMEIASRLLATRSDLTLLARLALAGGVEERDDLELLRGWRREAVGDDLLALLEGRTSVRLRPGSGSLTLALTERDDS